MGFKSRLLILASAAIAPGTVWAQAVPAVGTGSPAADLGGSISIDLITIRSASPGLPLRHGSIIPGSERVEYNGEVLNKGRDYQIDYEAGVIYLMRPQKIGQTVRVTSRYEKSKQQESVQTMNFKSSLPTYRFDLAPGLHARLGLGFAERQADGNVLMSNVYGVDTNFGGLNGFMLVGERSKTDARSEYEYQAAPGETPTGKSTAILQKFQKGFAGGKVTADYQDISSNFTAFSAMGESGMDAARVGQLKKEKGLKRLGFSAEGLSLGTSKLSSGFRQVRDGGASIDWKNFGFENQGLKMNYSSQKVDSDFTRFQDLSEGDWQQLAKERGMTRQNFGASYSPKLGQLSFGSSEIEDSNGSGIYRRSLSLKGKSFGMDYSDQQIDDDFRRFDSLWEPERGQWGREAGMRRLSFNLDAQMGGALAPLLRHSEFSSPNGRFSATDATVKAGSWSLQHSSRGSDATFDRMGSMAEPEMDSHISAIAAMYGAQGNPQERQAFLGGVGLERQFTRAAGQPFKGWNLDIRRFEMDGQTDQVGQDSIDLDTGKAKLSVRNLKIGETFTELNRIMRFERERLGTIAGLKRTDFDLTMKLSPSSAARMTSMHADTPEGAAARTHLEYQSKNLNVEANSRSVDPGFGRVNELVDPEKDLLKAMQGFDQRDIKINWKLNAKLTLDFFDYTAFNALTSEGRALQNVHLNWKPDGKSDIDLVHMANRQQDPTQLLFGNTLDRVSLSRDFGRAGLLRFMKEDIGFEGPRAQAPDTHRQYLSYEAKVDSKTDVKTEQTRTQFGNGDKENISAHTISTSIAKSAGVSVTEVHVDRNGSERDEQRRNYGFWLNLGKGLKVNYGWVRQTTGGVGTMNSNVNITPGTLDFIKLDSASYAENRWDGLRSQAMTNISLGSARPLDLLFLKNVQFGYTMDTATDQTAWVRENRMGSISGKVGSNTFALAYKSQMHNSGYRGIDRSFSFETDQDPKKWFVAHVRYTARQLPEDSQVMMRDIGFTLRGKGFELSNQMVTNPEDPQPRPDLPMFRMVNPWRVNKWNLKYDANPNLALGASWEERLNSQTAESLRVGGITLDMFKATGSPMQVFYGVEQRWGNVNRVTAHRWWLKYDQRPGPNQVLSLFVGNLSYQGAIPTPKKDNWSLNINYQIRF